MKISATRGLGKILRRPVHLFKYSLLRLNSYFGQVGEDVIVEYLFKSVGITKPSYLELGTNDPCYGNNTYKFYLKGVSGVLVEPDETMLAHIRQMRPRDVILNLGVGRSAGMYAEFFIFDLGTLNTFSRKEAETRVNLGTHKLKRVSIVQMKSVNEIIKEHFAAYPEFLSIDIEGMDLDVLSELDSSIYPIPVICAETCTFSENRFKSKDTRIIDLMQEKGYFVYADTYINTIFVHRAWFEGKKQ